MHHAADFEPGGELKAIIDVGYGDTKYALLDGERVEYGKIPSMVTRVSGTSRDFGGFGEKKSISYGDGSYLVGELARFLGMSRSTLSSDFLLRFSPVLIGAIYLRHDVREVKELYVSLSLKDFDLGDRLIERLKSIAVNDRTYTHDRVSIYAQGIGIWCAFGSPENAVVVDIGFNTVDVVVVDAGQPVREFSDGIAGLGAVSFLSKAATVLSQQMGTEFSAQEVGYLLQKEDGLLQRIGIEEEVRHLAAEWTEILWEQLMSMPHFKRIAVYRNEILVGGGGAYFFKPDRMDRRIKVLFERPEFGNVSGFVESLRDG